MVWRRRRGMIPRSSTDFSRERQSGNGPRRDPLNDLVRKRKERGWVGGGGSTHDEVAIDGDCARFSPRAMPTRLQWFLVKALLRAQESAGWVGRWVGGGGEGSQPFTLEGEGSLQAFRRGGRRWRKPALNPRSELQALFRRGGTRRSEACLGHAKFVVVGGREGGGGAHTGILRTFAVELGPCQQYRRA